MENEKNELTILKKKRKNIFDKLDLD